MKIIGQCRHVKLKLPCGPQKQQKLLEGLQKVIELSHAGHNLQNLVVKNDFTVLLVPKNGLLKKALH